MSKKHSDARIKAQVEQFAQLRAEGKQPHECYAAIFPKTKYPERNVGRYLKMHPEIETRAAEIVAERKDARNRVLSRAEELAALDEAYVLAGLKENYERCMQARPVLDRDGDAVFVETPDGKVQPAYAYDAKNALRALHLLGLKLGMFVHRHAVVEDPFAQLPLEQVRMIRDALRDLRGHRVLDHEPIGTKHADAVPQLAAQPAA